MLAADFEIGHFIRERVVPRAALYFTGEMFDDDGGAYSEGDEDEVRAASYIKSAREA